MFLFNNLHPVKIQPEKLVT